MKRRPGLILLAVMFLVAVVVAGCTSIPAAKTGKSPAERMKTIGIIGGISWQSSVDYYVGRCPGSHPRVH